MKHRIIYVIMNVKKFINLNKFSHINSFLKNSCNNLLFLKIKAEILIDVQIGQKDHNDLKKAFLGCVQQGRPFSRSQLSWCPFKYFLVPIGVFLFTRSYFFNKNPSKKSFFK